MSLIYKSFSVFAIWSDASRYRLAVLFVALFVSTLAMGQIGERYDEEEIQTQGKFIEAKGLLLQSKYDKAIDILKDIIRDDDSRHTVDYELARAYQLSGDQELSKKYIDQALLLEPQNETYLIFLTDHYKRSMLYDEVISSLDQLILLQPRNNLYYEQKADAQMAMKLSGAALETYRQMESVTGVTPISVKRKFDIYNMLDDKVGAEKELKKLVNDNPGSIEHMESLAKFYKQTDQHAKSIKVYKEILELEPSHSLASHEVRSASMSSENVNTGNLLSFINSPKFPIEEKIKALIPHIESVGIMSDDKAKSDLNGAVDILTQQHPRDPRCHAIRGDVSYRLENYSKAAGSYIATLDIDISVYDVWNNLLSCYEQLEDAKKRSMAASDAIDYFPNEVSAYLQKADALIDLKEYNEASEHIDMADIISGNNPRLTTGVALTRHRLMTATSASEDSQKLLQNLLAEKMNIFPDLLEKFGDAFQRSSNIDKAVQYWNKAMEKGYTSGLLRRKIKSASL